MLESRQIGRAQRIRLGNYRYEVDSRAKSLHHLNVKGFQSMSGRSDKIQTSMHAQVDLVDTSWLLLL